MKNEEKTEQLERQRTILLHTLDFLMSHYTGYFVTDDYDPSREYYIQEKKQVEKYFAERRLTQLNNKLEGFRKLLYAKKDEYYLAYIAHCTGFPSTLYHELAINMQRILDEGKISNNQDALEVEFLLAINKNVSIPLFDTTQLQNYLNEYRNNSVPLNSLVPTIESIIVNAFNVDETDLRTIEKIKSQMYSPNGESWMELQTSGEGQTSLTYVVAGVDGSTGTIYCVKGQGVGIKIEWADNHTILIHTSQEHEIVSATRILKTKHTTIDINYIFDSDHTS